MNTLKTTKRGCQAGATGVNAAEAGWADTSPDQQDGVPATFSTPCRCPPSGTVDLYVSAEAERPA